MKTHLLLSSNLIFQANLAQMSSNKTYGQKLEEERADLELSVMMKQWKLILQIMNICLFHFVQFIAKADL